MTGDAAVDRPPDRTALHGIARQRTARVGSGTRAGPFAERRPPDRCDTAAAIHRRGASEPQPTAVDEEHAATRRAGEGYEWTAWRAVAGDAVRISLLCSGYDSPSCNPHLHEQLLLFNRTALHVRRMRRVESRSISAT